MLLKIIC